MTFLQSVRIALRSIGANKLRAGLTMLGIIIQFEDDFTVQSQQDILNTLTQITELTRLRSSWVALRESR